MIHYIVLQGFPFLVKLFPGLALFQEVKITIGQDKTHSSIISLYLFSVCIKSEDEDDEVGVPADLF